jgi:acetyltransferase-like isoleucine patch superfamily enzyme
MTIQKIYWWFRTLFYKPFFKKLGKHSYIGKPLTIRNYKGITVGSRVRIYPYARIEVINKGSSIIFEDNISIGQCFHIVSAGRLIIKKNTTISANVFMTNVDHSYKDIDVHIMKQNIVIKTTTIGENCYIGYGAVIQAGTLLGRQCIVGANSVVRGEFPDYCVIVGSPAKIIKRYDKAQKEWKRTDEKGRLLE